MIVKSVSYCEEGRIEYTTSTEWPKNTTFMLHYGYNDDRHGYNDDRGDTYKFQAFCNGYIFSGIMTEAKEAEKEALRDFENRVNNLCQYNHKNPANCEKRGYDNGCGFCKHCGMFVSNVYPVEKKCIMCGKTTNWYEDKNGDLWCRECEQNYFANAADQMQWRKW